MEFSMNLDELFAWLKRLAKGLHAVIGPNCEIVLHDFRDVEHSVIAIEGNLSGRQPGAPLPDLQFIKGDTDLPREDQLNYQIQIGRKTLQSSTIWIQNRDGQLLGALCINMDYSSLQQAHTLLESLLEPLQQNPEFIVQDSLARDIEDLVAKTIHGLLENSLEKNPAQLPAPQKKNLVQNLEKSGVFQLRGAVECVCEMVDISRATLYNYRRG